jgi:hypothetical protein
VNSPWLVEPDLNALKGTLRDIFLVHPGFVWVTGYSCNPPQWK